MEIEDLVKILNSEIKDINVEKKKSLKKGGVGNLFSGFFGGGKPAQDLDLTKEEYEIIEKTVNKCIENFTKIRNIIFDETGNFVDAQISIDSISLEFTRNIINHELLNEKGYLDSNMIYGREGFCFILKNIKSNLRKSEENIVLDGLSGDIQLKCITMVNSNNFIVPLFVNNNPSLENKNIEFSIKINKNVRNVIKFDVVNIFSLN